MDKNDLLPIGEAARRSGVSVATLRFYEERGLICSERTPGNQRVYARHELRRIAFVRAGVRFGVTLTEIGEALSVLPTDRPPTKRDWQRVSRRWRGRLEEQIAALTKVRDDLAGCIGCGCLSLAACPIYNPDDELAAEGPGARRLPEAARAPADPQAKWED